MRVHCKAQLDVRPRTRTGRACASQQLKESEIQAKQVCEVPVLQESTSRRRAPVVPHKRLQLHDPVAHLRRSKGGGANR